MNLDSVTAELRPRTAWEATDFGARMIRRDVAVIYRVWFLLTLPVFLLAVLGILYSPIPAYVYLLMWWLEPVFDGPILHVISRRLFGEESDVRGALRATLPSAKRNWIYWLTPYRFHFARSLVLPLTQLEGLSGKARRNRAKALNKTTHNHGTGITVAYQHLFLSVYLGLIMLGYAFIPETFQDTLGPLWFDRFFEQEDTASYILSLALIYAAQSILHPWFVGAGFGLYINSRTILEAWDVEVSFRRMMQRRVRTAGGAIVSLLCVSVLFATDGAQAKTTELAAYWDERKVDEAVDRVFQDDALQTYETIESWTRINPEDEHDVEENGAAGVASFLRGIGKLVSLLIEFGLWLLVAALLILIFLTRARWLPYLRSSPRVKADVHRVELSSGVITKESLPGDIPATVLELWRAGKNRAALALLYRGSVFGVVSRYGVRLPRSATEGACVSAVNAQAAEQADFFKRIVAAWSWCAYASRVPSSQVVEALCDEWPNRYGAAQ